MGPEGEVGVDMLFGQSGTPWLTTKEAAEYLRYSPETIRAACRADQLQHVQIGRGRGKLLTTRKWLDEWAFKHAHGGE